MILQYRYTEHADCMDVWVLTKGRAMYYRTKLSGAPTHGLDERRHMEVRAELALHQALVVGA